MWHARGQEFESPRLHRCKTVGGGKRHLQSTVLHESLWVSLPGGTGEYVITRLDPLALHSGTSPVARISVRNGPSSGTGLRILDCLE
jgi:hypothetical protein